jgi:V/A-type H+/Na+-transporting ATPase subunit I
MMRLSVGIGVVHLILANLEMAGVQRGRAAGRVALGWIAVMLGGFTLWIAGDAGAPEWVILSAQILMGLGLAVVLLLGSDRRVDGVKALALRGFDGLSNLVRVTQVFGDVLSYLRLFALGLASASMAMTFNGLARDVATELPGSGTAARHPDPPGRTCAESAARAHERRGPRAAAQLHRILQLGPGRRRLPLQTL